MLRRSLPPRPTTKSNRDPGPSPRRSSRRWNGRIGRPVFPAALAVVALLVPCANALKPPKKDMRQLAVVDLLRQIWFAQEFQKRHVAIDADGDLVGEYASLAELGSGALIRNTFTLMKDVLPPHPLGEELGQIDGNGYLKRYGYYFQLFLPDIGDSPLPEVPYGGPHASVNATACESNWVVYAWPAGGKVARDIYAINQDGVVTCTNGAVVRYHGTYTPVQAGIEAQEAGSNYLSEPFASAEYGQGPGTDGNMWRRYDLDAP